MTAPRPPTLSVLVVALTLSGCASTGSLPSAGEASAAGTPSVGTANGKDPALTAVALLPRPDGPAPLRTPAQVMRVWIAPWEDSRGDLHAPGYLFTEIAPRRWSLATPHEPLAGRRITPLQIERREGPSGVTTRPGSEEGVRERGQTPPPRTNTRASPPERMKS